MSIRFLKTVTFVVCAALSSFALAETPARVGRIALSQGPVSISGEVGEETTAAIVNWPVTSRNQISTGRSGRTEIRIGSTAVRLDSDSALDIVELDDDNLRLHLHYGSVNVRVRSEESVRGFELSTPQGAVRLREPGRLRIDAGRVPETTSVNVFDGVALVDDGGSSLTVRAGKRVDLHREDVRTSLAVRDSFDDWAMLRDQRDDRVTSDRYVTREMTGYEELDQHGVWHDDSDYGPLWQPRSVPAGWVPYRDGRWTYLQPWGWTWVDNAPWGYAPSHYGRWVMVNQRWCWAPGRNIGRPVWAPALVGWIGGSNWSLAFSSGGRRPAQGWYPLSPREHYVPGYRVSQDHLRHINRHSSYDRRDDDRRGRRDDDHRRAGLTVVPHENFGRRNAIVVPLAPRAAVAPANLMQAAAMAPPVPAGAERGGENRRFGRDGGTDRRDRNDQNERFTRNTRGERNTAGFERPALPQAQPAVPQLGATPAAPVPQAVPYSRRDERDGDRPRYGERNGERNGDRFNNNNDDQRRMRVPSPMVTAPALPSNQTIMMPQQQMQQQAQQIQQPQDRGNRGFRGDGERERRQREPDQRPAPIAMPQPMPQPQIAQPVRQAPPQVQMPQPQPQPQPQIQQPRPPQQATQEPAPRQQRRMDMREDKPERGNARFNQQ